jgi:hypothetical protein
VSFIFYIILQVLSCGGKKYGAAAAGGVGGGMSGGLLAQLQRNRTPTSV